MEEQKKRLENAQAENKELESKYWSVLQEKDMTESRFKDEVRKIYDRLTRKERELNEMQSKTLGAVDMELEKKKIENQMELRYQKDLNDKQRELDDKGHLLQSLVQENELMKFRLESIQKDHENATGILKNAHKKQLDALMKEIAEYQNMKVFNTPEEKLQNLKIQKEELSKKNDLLEGELSSLKNELNALKVKHNQVIVEDAREMDRIRGEGWGAKNERDQLSFKNEALAKENQELRDKFSDYEKRIVDSSNDHSNLNRLNLQKEKEIEALMKKIANLEEDALQKNRSLKNTLEEQAHTNRLQHANELKNHLDENRRLKDNLARLEERVKNATQTENQKERNMIEVERKNAQLNDKISSLLKQLKDEKETSDKYLLDNEEIKRKLVRTEARNKQLTQENREYQDSTENTSNINRNFNNTTRTNRNVSNTEQNINSNTVSSQEHNLTQNRTGGAVGPGNQVGFVDQNGNFIQGLGAPAGSQTHFVQAGQSGQIGQPGQTGGFSHTQQTFIAGQGNPGDKKTIDSLRNKIHDLKGALKTLNEKLVKAVSDKVMLLKRIQEAGIDLGENGKFIGGNGGKKVAFDSSAQGFSQNQYEVNNKQNFDMTPSPLVTGFSAGGYNSQGEIPPGMNDAQYLEGNQVSGQGQKRCPVHPEGMPPMPPSSVMPGNLSLYSSSNPDIVPYLSSNLPPRWEPYSHSKKILIRDEKLGARTDIERNPVLPNMSGQNEVHGRRSLSAGHDRDLGMVSLSTYKSGAKGGLSDLSESELQDKISNLLHKKETFFMNA